LHRQLRADWHHHALHAPAPDDRCSLIPVKGKQVRAVEAKELSGFLGHYREDVRRRVMAGDQGRYPAESRLLVGQNAAGLLGPGGTPASVSRDRAHHGRQGQQDLGPEPAARLR
jgi:hypothetical protein